jgi:hypothetical protein
LLDATIALVPFGQQQLPPFVPIASTLSYVNVMDSTFGVNANFAPSFCEFLTNAAKVSEKQTVGDERFTASAFRNRAAKAISAVGKIRHGDAELQDTCSPSKLVAAL